MKKNGFTLLELAISLLIVGLLFAGILGPLSTRVEQKERQTTQALLDEIKESLYGFAMVNGRLPCPDTGTDGVEDPVNGVGGCSAATGTGALPYATLGVSKEDSWGSGFTYSMTKLFGDDTDGTGACVIPVTPTLGVSFELCADGDIIIEDEAGNTIVDKIPALVFSGGKEKYTGSSLETENSNGDIKFVYTDYRQEPTKEFDDLMIWISPNILKNRMVQAGRLP